MKLWSGRFQKETDSLVNDFNSSIRFDSPDVPGGYHRAPSPMRRCWASSGIIARSTRPTPIIDGLQAILADIEAGNVEFSAEQRGYPHEYGDHAHPAHRRRGQAPAHRPEPERSGGRGPAALSASEEIQARSSARSWTSSRSSCSKAKASTWTPSCPATPTCSGPSPPPSPSYLMAYANMLKPGRHPSGGLPGHGWTSAPWAAGALAASTYPVDRFADGPGPGLPPAH